MSGFTFNGVTSKSKYITAIRTNRTLLPSAKHRFVEIPFKSGSYLISDDSESDIIIPIICLLEVPSHISLFDYGRSLAAWLNTDNWKRLIFDDDPNYYYDAVCTSSITVDDIRPRRVEIRIEFRCKSTMKAVT